MKAVSIHQPWAWAILHAGKDIENRSWPTSCRGPLLIHASKSKVSYDRESAGWRATYGCELPPWEELATGAILGVVDLVDCVPLEQAGGSIWAQGEWCWMLANSRPFARPIPFKGLQRIFNVAETDDLLQQAKQPR